MPLKERDKDISSIVSQYAGKLMSFIRSKVNNTEDAEDILQEVWVQFSNLTNLSDILNVSSWLYKVTSNKIIDKYRKKKTENIEDFVYEDEEGDAVINDALLEDHDQDVEMKLFQEEILEQLFKALEKLPEKQRLVYVQNELEGKTMQQIADEQNENIKTIISRKNYAVKYLKSQLKELYEDLIN